MQNPKNNSSKISYWIKKTIFTISWTGIFAVISLPSSSQENILIDFFHPYEDLVDSDVYKAKNDNLIKNLEKANNFHNLVDEFEVAGLTETLKNEYFVLLAPNDKAFETLSDNEFEIFQKQENQIVILEYHLIPRSSIPKKEFLRNKEKVKIATYEGNEITVYLHNNELRINDDNTIISNRIRSNNGIIYEINQILSPPSILETTRTNN